MSIYGIGFDFEIKSFRFSPHPAQYLSLCLYSEPHVEQNLAFDISIDDYIGIF